MDTNFYGVSENFLDVTDLDYYLPNEYDTELIAAMQEAGVEIPRTARGDVDVIRLLYANQTTSSSKFTAYDENELTDTNYADVDAWLRASAYFDDIPVILPEGLRDVLS